MKNKKWIALSILIVLAVDATAICVWAADAESELQQILTDALKAGIVCTDHLLEDCPECVQPQASYYTVCPSCNIEMTQCCSEQCAYDDRWRDCPVVAHGDGCSIVQDVYWNAYVCMSCGYFERGSHSDDYHVEAYWHTKDSTCFDNNFCRFTNLSDLLAQINPASETEPNTEIQSNVPYFHSG